MIQELESISKIWQVIYVIFVNFIFIHIYNTLKAMIWFMKIFHILNSRMNYTKRRFLFSLD